MHFKAASLGFFTIAKGKTLERFVVPQNRSEDGCRKIPHLHNMNGGKHLCWKQNVFEPKFSGPNHYSRSFFPRKTAAKKEQKMHWLHVFFRKS